MVPFRPAISMLEATLGEGKLERTYTDGDLATELWLSLHQLAEVQEVGMARLCAVDGLRAGSTPEAMASDWHELRAYLRQAENFFAGATVLHWTSSPLNYYYSFLNLAKASCLLENVFKSKVGGDSSPAATEATPRRVRHGLFEKILIGSPDQWMLRVDASKEVFPLYYELSVGKAIAPETVLEVHDLLGYSLPIGWQLRRSGYASKIRSFQCRWAMLRTTTETWDVVGIPRTAPVTELPPQFFERYDEIEPATIKEPALKIFDIRAVEAKQMRFYQCRVPYPLEANGDFHTGGLVKDFRNALPCAAFPNLSNEKHQFVLSLSCPITGGAPVSMNSEIATYACWFFLSSLVRYHPDYMESISKSNDAWLIESFVKSAPLDILRALTARILGYSLVMLRV